MENSTTPQSPQKWASEQLEKVATALSKFQGEQETINFDQDNPYYKSRYASLSALIAGTRRNLSKHGLAVTQIESEGTLQTFLLHTSGQWICSTTIIERDEAAKNAAQAKGKNQTYARRYAYAAILGLASDEDNDGNNDLQAAAPRGRQQAPAPIPVPAAKFTEKVKKQIGAAETREELAEVYKSNLGLQQNLKFVEALSNRQQEIEVETIDYDTHRDGIVRDVGKTQDLALLELFIKGLDKVFKNDSVIAEAVSNREKQLNKMVEK